jgi:Rieske Fe-S protein
METQDAPSRRGVLMKLAILCNGVVGAVLAIPVVRFVLSSVTRGSGDAYRSWVSLGSAGQFPEGETRLATFRNPYVNPSDGKTADTACWVRHVEGDRFQVFAVNCAHLGCPVRWFPQSGLFLCPCHGGAYYRDGSRAAGPPERGMFEYPYKLENGAVMIQAGELPTPGASAANRQQRHRAGAALVAIGDSPCSAAPCSAAQSSGVPRVSEKRSPCA